MRWGPYIAEFVRALALLALVFLNFAYVPAVSAGSGFALDPLSYCGTPADGHDRTRHAPCTACRIGGDAGLVPPCPFVLRLPARGERLAPLARTASVDARPAHLPPARGPPLT